MFQHVIWVVARFVRSEWGWRISCYMDDIALFCQVQAMAERRTARLALLLEELGFTLNRAKSVGIPGAEKGQGGRAGTARLEPRPGRAGRAWRARGRRRI